MCNTSFDEKTLATHIEWHCPECRELHTDVYSSRTAAHCKKCGTSTPWSKVMTPMQVYQVTANEEQRHKHYILLQKHAGGVFANLDQEAMERMLHEADGTYLVPGVREWLMLNSNEIPATGIVALINWQPQLLVA